MAASTRNGLEPELALAIDPLVPSGPLIESIRALNGTFPDLMVTFSTEGLGGSLRRLRSGSAALAICMLPPVVPDDIVAFPLMRVRLLAVASRDHPLAASGRPAERVDLPPMCSSSCLILSIQEVPTMGSPAKGGGDSWISEDAWTFCSRVLGGAGCPFL